jgi:hypothetical protein
MGKWKNGKTSATIGWILTAIMTVSGVAAIYALFFT